MRERTELNGLTTLVVLTRIADGVTTRLATPDLSREMNPQAAGGWPLLIASAAVVVVIATILHALSLYRPVDNFPVGNGTPVGLDAFRKHDFDPHGNPLLRANPWRLTCDVFGYVMPRALILWSLLLIANNAATAIPIGWYVDLKRKYPVWLVSYGALPVIGVVLVDRLQRRDYARDQCRRG